jgi:hypothetical protein
LITEVEDQLFSAGYPRSNYKDEPNVRQNAFLGFWALARDEACSVDDLFLGCLRMLEWAKSSTFGPLLLPELGDWASKRWTEAAEAQRFRLRNPRLTVEAIQAAASDSIARPDRLAAILRAAHAGFSFRIASGLQDLFRG